MIFEIREKSYQESATDSEDSEVDELSDAESVVRHFAGNAPKKKPQDDLLEINRMLEGLREQKFTLTGTLRDSEVLTVFVHVSASEDKIKFSIQPSYLKQLTLNFDRVIVVNAIRPEVFEFLRVISQPCTLEFTAKSHNFSGFSHLDVSTDEIIQVLDRFKTLVISDPFFAIGSLGKEFSRLENLEELIIQNSRIADEASQENLDAILQWLPPGVKWLTIKNLVTYKTFENLRSLVKRHSKLRDISFGSIPDFTLEKLIIREFIQERKIRVTYFGSFTSHVNFSGSSMLETIVYLTGIRSGGHFSSLGADVRRLLVSLIFGEFPSSVYFK